jgi:hypothetical protein
MSFIPLVGLSQTSTRTGVKQSLRSQTEIGYIYTRSQMLPKQKFTLNYLLTSTDCATLETFFYNNVGTIFNLVFDGVTYSVIFISDEFAPRKVSLNMREVSLDCREI